MSALGLADLRWRSRRDPGGGPPLVHPGFLRDAGERRTAAAIAGVAGYLASLVGHPRRDYDPDVPVEIAGDRRFGRALVTVCMDWYRWRGRGFAEALPGPVADGLARAGVETSSALRLRLFDLANAEYAGFVPAARRGEALGRLAAALGLGADAVDALDAALTLDAEEEAVLEATAPSPPSAAAIAGAYNRATLAALLRHAERIIFAIRAPDGALVRRLYAVCRRLGVYCDVEQDVTGGFRLTLSGPDAVVAAPAAAGPRLATVALRLLRAVGAGDNAVAHLLLHERPYRLILDGALLALPGLAGAPGEQTGATSEDDDEPGAFDSAVEARLAREFAALRRQGRALGWRLVREPAPLMAGGRVLIPDFALVRGDLRVFVEVVGFWTPGYVSRKRAALERLDPATPLALAVAEGPAAALEGLPFPLLRYRDAVPAPALIAAVEDRYGDFAARTAGAADRVVALCAPADPGATSPTHASDGWVTEEALAAALGCHSPGEVQRALAAIDLPTGWTPIPGGGLCGPTLRRRLAGALDSAWQREPIGTGLSLSDLRRLIPDLNLPPDGVLAALLEALPGVAVVRGSLFEMRIVPAGAAIAAAAAPDLKPPSAAAASLTRPPRPARRSPRKYGATTSVSLFSFGPDEIPHSS